MVVAAWNAYIQGGSSGFRRSLLLETYRIAKGLISERDNILKLSYDIDSSANQAYAVELYLSSTGK
jgi:hypothetical protein